MTRLILQSHLFVRLFSDVLKKSLLPPPFVSMPLAPVKLLHKMLKCKEATTWEVITASLKL